MKAKGMGQAMTLSGKVASKMSTCRMMTTDDTAWASWWGALDCGQDLLELSTLMSQGKGAVQVVCGDVRGGAVSRTGFSLTSRSPFDCERTVFEPSLDINDTIAACWQWLVNKELNRSLSFVHLRLVAKRWAISAIKQQYLVAGVSFESLAEPWGLTAREYVEIHWNPDSLRAPPVCLSFVLGCVFSISAAVVDEDNLRPDGLWAPSKWRIRVRQG
eukprot:2511841-Amphidinium_carterae.1